MKITSYLPTLMLSVLTLLGCGQIPIRSTNYSYQKPQQIEDGLKTDNPQSVGMDTIQIIALTKLILADSFPNIHSLLIYKDNKLVYENYFAGKDQISSKNLGYVEHHPEDLHDCRSISKSIVSACIGIAIKQDLIKSIDEPIFNYFPEYEKHLDSAKSKITIRHLLTMTSGLEWNEMGSYGNFFNSETQMNIRFNPIKYILKQDIVSEPGTKWNYNGGNTQLLAEIIKKVSGLPIDKFAEKNLFQPLGIKKYAWQPLFIKKIPAAASGLRLTSRDFLKFGLLYMDNGKWNNTQIIDSTWTEQSLKPFIERPALKIKFPHGGYGYQFWTYADTIKNKAIEIAEAKGNGGQAIFFCKSLNLLVVTTAGNYNQLDNINDPYKILTNYIIPAIK